jgi:hypothetical protein
MTLDEFLDWDPGDESGARWQLIDGEPAAMAPARQYHAAIMAEAELLRRGPDGNWPAEPEMATGGAMLNLASIDYATALSAFYRTTGLAA